MFYYEVLVGDLQYHGKSALTYSSEVHLLPGSVVRIALRARSVLGIVLREVPEPSFAAKPVAAVMPDAVMPAQQLELIDWLYGYYPAPFGTIVRQFLPPTTAFPRKGSTDQAPNAESQTDSGFQIPDSKEPAAPQTSTIQHLASNLPHLTPDQSAALKAIQPSGYHLLHGITGSGKTRIYIELTRRALAAGTSTIILTPEIGLTAQLTCSFTAAFTERVYVLHSRLTAAARRDIWHSIISSTAPVIVIGPRSALFAPVQRLGLIVIDESHDQAYKSDSSPHYRTERVAARLAQLHGACLVSGTATPSIEEYYLLEAKKRPIITLQSLAVTSTAEVTTKTVDLRDRGNLTRSSILTTPLVEAIQSALGSHEQSLLFLNRRGTASAILCSHCGWQALCPHCDLAMTYHGDTHRIRCHVCGRTQPLPSSCPDCGETDIILKSVGTKAVVDELHRLFPNARVSRFDTDASKAEQLENQLDAFKNGSVDIIVGTQMVTKGLDLPGLSVVGILNADSSLLIPDYTASERTFQLLTQVIGRTGRGHRSGSVIIQTYNPTHPTIVAATQKDWAGYYARELDERRSFHFPPFTHLLKLTCLRATSASAEKTAMKLKEQIQKDHPRLNVEGPSPTFHPRESGKYKWQLIIKSPSRAVLVAIASNLPSGWQHDLDPVNLL